MERTEGMPIIEYECCRCGWQFEHLVMHSSPVPQCPSCQYEDLKRIVSIAAVRTESTRRRAVGDARERGSRIRCEKQHEEYRMIREHTADSH